jgi:hypothetical protein
MPKTSRNRDKSQLIARELNRRNDPGVGTTAGACSDELRRHGCRIGGLSTVERSVTVIVPFIHEFDVFITIYNLQREGERRGQRYQEAGAMLKLKFVPALSSTSYRPANRRKNL